VQRAQFVAVWIAPISKIKRSEECRARARRIRDRAADIFDTGPVSAAGLRFIPSQSDSRQATE